MDEKNPSPNPSPIKYFTVGEYGEKTDRPHFHSIIFNADQQNILDAWDCGNVHFGEVNEASITYTLKYAMKKIGRVHKKGWKDINSSREVERALISQGIGKEYIENPKTRKYYQDEITRQVLKEGGLVSALPRYYKEKVYSEGQLFARAQALIKSAEAGYSPEKIRENQALAWHKFTQEEKKKRSRTD